ncbi:hypothetical protein QKD39_gp10 [Psittacine adenovirus 1]|uniref:Uncharacterized protein n=1 Tax=Psittacine adenovirus 1 TaxID=318592 RepID=A0A2Z5E1B4_9ADEN|nr:hypothetical protein QKD39_gp10 [Psittacine adenovirus 1]AXB73022.1 hypothetical protein [Psittacine adenovirus 1]
MLCRMLVFSWKMENDQRALRVQEITDVIWTECRWVWTAIFLLWVMCMGILGILYLINADLTELATRLSQAQSETVLYCCNSYSGSTECSS